MNAGFKPNCVESINRYIMYMLKSLPFSYSSLLYQIFIAQKIIWGDNGGKDVYQIQTKISMHFYPVKENFSSRNKFFFLANIDFLEFEGYTCVYAVKL